MAIVHISFKKDGDMNVKYKALLVMKGCSQNQGIDYQERYSPVVKYASLCYLFALSSRDNLQIDHR